MAAPHVAGAAALVLGANPSLTPVQVRGLLESTGECPDGSRRQRADVRGPRTMAGRWPVRHLARQGRHPRTARQRAPRRAGGRQRAAAACRHPARLLSQRFSGQSQPGARDERLDDDQHDGHQRTRARRARRDRASERCDCNPQPLDCELGQQLHVGHQHGHRGGWDLHTDGHRIRSVRWCAHSNRDADDQSASAVHVSAPGKLGEHVRITGVRPGGLER